MRIEISLVRPIKGEEARPEVLVEPCSSLETFLTGRASGRLDLDLQFPRFHVDSRKERGRGMRREGTTPLRQITSILRPPPLRPISTCRAVRAQFEEGGFSFSHPATLHEKGRTRKERNEGDNRRVERLVLTVGREECKRESPLV